MKEKRAPKSEWGRVSCRTDGDKEAIRSWFLFLSEGLAGPTKCAQLERLSDGHILKLRALFEDEQGQPRELIRTFGREFKVTSRRPSSTVWP